jgi:hypothetical protein
VQQCCAFRIIFANPPTFVTRLSSVVFIMLYIFIEISDPSPMTSSCYWVVGVCIIHCEFAEDTSWHVVKTVGV